MEYMPLIRAGVGLVLGGAVVSVEPSSWIAWALGVGTAVGVLARGR